MAGFNICIPLQKSIDGELIGVASTSSVDRDDEKMSDDALQAMVKDIKAVGVNLFENHEHGWQNTLGVIKDAELVNKQVQVKINLDDPSTNPKIPMLLNKLKKGIKLGLSVGGNVTGYKWEYDRAVGKKVKVLDQVKIYEVSVVGIPSNADSFVSLPMAIAKSAKITKGQPGKNIHGDAQTCNACDVFMTQSELDNDDGRGYCARCRRQADSQKSCPICHNSMQKQCGLCFYKED